MFLTLLFWFIWFVGFSVVGFVVTAAVYVGIDKERRDRAMGMYNLSQALINRQQRSSPKHNDDASPPPPKKKNHIFMKPPPPQTQEEVKKTK